MVFAMCPLKTSPWQNQNQSILTLRCHLKSQENGNLIVGNSTKEEKRQII